MFEAAKESKIDPLSVDGLEEVFEAGPVTEVEALDAEPITSAEKPVSCATEPVPSGAEVVPVEEAAEILGTSVNALKKRLRKGTVKGLKLEAKHGDKWFVEIAELSVSEAPVAEVEASNAEPVTGAEKPVSCATEPVPTSKEAQDAKLLAIIENQAHQLKAAGDVIMYMRLQLEEKESQIKLLTDSQQKAGRWQRFCSWFLGR